MRIIIENGTPSMHNFGDIAMLQTTIRRLKEFWPYASIAVLCDDVERQRRFCLGTDPLSLAGRDAWSQSYQLADGSLTQGRFVGSLVAGVEQCIRRWWPGSHASLVRWRLRRRKACPKESGDFFRVFRQADAVVAAGGGYIADLFAPTASRILQHIVLAQNYGKPTAFFGIGIGPVEQPRLRGLAQRALSQACLVSLREGRIAPLLLKSWGIPEKRFSVTGDDAIEMAYLQRTDSLGSGLGVNLRMTSYSQMERTTLDVLAHVTREQAERLDARRVALPISLLANATTDSDIRVLEQLLCSDVEALDQLHRTDSLENLFGCLRRCRLVVTGAYHAAVFALSQGIPVVALVKSEYYSNKFGGLKDQFGEGCTVLTANADSLRERLVAAIDQQWRRAPELRAGLWAAAKRQIASSRKTYAQFHALIEEHAFRRKPLTISRQSSDST
jgi:polysaccharide pyruvyl transferase WcaK-like protein